MGFQGYQNMSQVARSRTGVTLILLAVVASALANAVLQAEAGDAAIEEVDFVGEEFGESTFEDRAARERARVAKVRAAHYYNFTVPGTGGDNKVEVCRQLFSRQEVREWLQMTTRQDLRKAQKKKQELDAVYELARSKFTEARAAARAAKQVLKTLTTSAYAKGIKKLQISCGRKEEFHSLVTANRRLLGRGSV